MIKCKVCGKECGTLTGIARHSKKAHNIVDKEYKELYKELYPQKVITEDMIQCKICGEYSKPLGMPSHLARKHNLSGKDYYDQYCKTESEGICKICGKPTSFRGINIGYSKYCGPKCSNLDPDTQEKLKNTFLTKYGVDHPLKSKDIQNKMKQSCKEKYGVDSFMKTKEFREKSKEALTNEEVKQKRIQTCLERYGAATPFQSKEIQQKVKESFESSYGVDNPWKANEVKDKIKQTWIDKYGTDNPSKNKIVLDQIHNTISTKYGGMGSASPIIKEKMRSTNLQKYGVENVYQSDLIKQRIEETRHKNIEKYCEQNQCIAISDLPIEFPFLCVEQAKVQILVYNKNKKFVYIKDIDIIKQCEKHLLELAHAKGTYGEKELYDYITSIYNGTVELRTRQIIPPLELDLYIPDKKVAIEFNGTYWHSVNNGMDNKYHLRKSLLCKNKGIRLIHIFEYDWLLHQDICKSIIASALGIYKQKIFARQCKIQEVSFIESSKFLEINHIQGKVKSNINYGLYYNNELVQLICLGKSRFKSGEIELLRMCTKLNTQVIGGFSKLLQHQPYNDLISYIDIAKFNGNAYNTIGFNFVDFTPPSYNYIKGSIVLNRINAQKHKLRELLKDGFDENESESQNMIRNGWLQVFDCGTIKVQYIRR